MLFPLHRFFPRKRCALHCIPFPKSIRYDCPACSGQREFMWQRRLHPCTWSVGGKENSVEVVYGKHTELEGQPKGKRTAERRSSAAEGGSKVSSK
jgi:hypothetical protein